MNHRILLIISLGESSAFLIANCWKVDNDPIIDPPIHAEYLLCQSNSNR